jgi:hypothetical protein
MKFSTIQLHTERDVWALTLYVLWICSVGVIINNVGNRTDIFFTIGIMPVTFSVSFGLTHIF